MKKGVRLSCGAQPCHSHPVNFELSKLGPRPVPAVRGFRFSVPAFAGVGSYGYAAMFFFLASTVSGVSATVRKKGCTVSDKENSLLACVFLLCSYQRIKSFNTGISAKRRAFFLLKVFVVGNQRIYHWQ